ncbi:hypothetical protein SBOR_3268 [Sclerotinia borealis F-4128]|uniref:Cutinase n=1 Tax=Sclerotinia borealis (strain F-4128) TaxID=1432307 RepID=W9CKI0_SCLBF|nr:hypothetical protein SBOR_3268 [Sclerotinia borealis F-4128]
MLTLTSGLTTKTNSYAEGLVAAESQFTAYTESCEDSKMAILAYSQGAMVIGDVLAGGGGDEVLGAGKLQWITSH